MNMLGGGQKYVFIVIPPKFAPHFLILVILLDSGFGSALEWMNKETHETNHISSGSSVNPDITSSLRA